MGEPWTLSIAFSFAQSIGHYRKRYYSRSRSASRDRKQPNYSRRNRSFSRSRSPSNHNKRHSNVIAPQPVLTNIIPLHGQHVIAQNMTEIKPMAPQAIPVPTTTTM